MTANTPETTENLLVRLGWPDDSDSLSCKGDLVWQRQTTEGSSPALMTLSLTVTPSFIRAKAINVNHPDQVSAPHFEAEWSLQDPRHPGFVAASYMGVNILNRPNSFDEAVEIFKSLQVLVNARPTLTVMGRRQQPSSPSP